MHVNSFLKLHAMVLYFKCAKLIKYGMYIKFV